MNEFRVGEGHSHRDINNVILIMKLQLEVQLIKPFFRLMRLDNRRPPILHILPPFGVPTHTLLFTIFETEHHRPVSLPEK